MDDIWSCPDCGGDLVDGWCPACEISWAWAALATDPPEYQHPDEE